MLGQTVGVSTVLWLSVVIDLSKTVEQPVDVVPYFLEKVQYWCLYRCVLGLVYDRHQRPSVAV